MRQRGFWEEGRQRDQPDSEEAGWVGQRCREGTGKVGHTVQRRSKQTTWKNTDS